jgi:hypothetical protein
MDRLVCELRSDARNTLKEAQSHSDSRRCRDFEQYQVSRKVPTHCQQLLKTMVRGCSVHSQSLRTYFFGILDILSNGRGYQLFCSLLRELLLSSSSQRSKMRDTDDACMDDGKGSRNSCAISRVFRLHYLYTAMKSNTSGPTNVLFRVLVTPSDVVEYCWFWCLS